MYTMVISDICNKNKGYKSKYLDFTGKTENEINTMYSKPFMVYEPDVYEFDTIASTNNQCLKCKSILCSENFNNYISLEVEKLKYNHKYNHKYTMNFNKHNCISCKHEWYNINIPYCNICKIEAKFKEIEPFKYKAQFQCNCETTKPDYLINYKYYQITASELNKITVTEELAESDCQAVKNYGSLEPSKKQNIRNCRIM